MKFFGMIGMFLAVSLLSGAEILKFESNKILYDFQEKVIFNAEIKSNQTKKVSCKVIIRHGVNQIFTLPVQSIELKAGVPEKLTFNWNSGNHEYGFAAVLEVDGVKSEPQIFEVCHDWRKINRAGGMPVYHGIFDRSQYNGSEKKLDELIKFCRTYGYNRFHIYGSWQPQINQLNPEMESWHFWTSGEPEAGKNQKNVMIFGKRIQEVINKFHDNGIKVTTYIHTPTYAFPRESSIVYDAKNPQKKLHYPPDSKVRRQYLEAHNMGVVNAWDFANDFAPKLAGAIKKYGWDGIFMDDYKRLIEYTANGVNCSGKPLTEKTYQELYAEILNILVKETSAAKDNFVFFLNGLHHSLYGLQNFPSKNMFGKNGELFPEFSAAGMKNFAYSGEWRNITRQANSPWQLGRSLRAVKELTRTPLDIVWTIACPPSFAAKDAEFHGNDSSYTFKVESVLPFTAVIFANGLGYSEYYSTMPQGEYTDPARSEVAKARVKYLKFAARYGQYFYPLNSTWTAKDELKVTAPEHVYYKGNSFSHPVPGGREVTLNLINFDKPYLQALLWDRTRTVPPEVKDITVTLKLRAHEQISGVYAASPDNGGDAQKLDFVIENGLVKVKSPLLKYWNLLVFQIENIKE